VNTNHKALDRVTAVKEEAGLYQSLAVAGREASGRERGISSLQGAGDL
jgi:hypothetical protein